ncbi:undecaprenyl diphosphate synthase family protein [Streptomyces sp. N50]|uniref:undecaprenyl diphosphate synthase family protein n=1 Tax=Streptomyces sp. N50 TaxID=3081765 RepID=UPI0029623F50|nr:undecaprenyl diphosphate synthase family protein [Streptomyces sp. N50]WOX17113.1 undecaprenyl diphosphate synthase family protein [Streptomyces sp. N50]
MTPRHVAVLLDGHAQWAAAKGLTESEGFRASCAKQVDVARWCHDLGAHTVTLRVVPHPGAAPDHLPAEADWDRMLEAFRNGWEGAPAIALNHLGDLGRLPAGLADRLRAACTPAVTGARPSLQVNLAVGYDGHDEVLDALRSVLRTAQDGGRGLDEVAVSLAADDLGERLASRTLPPVDLFVRAAGGQHLSGLLLWQSVYSEFHFSDIPAPALTRDDLAVAFADYSGRNRRYGK